MIIKLLFFLSGCIHDECISLESNFPDILERVNLGIKNDLIQNLIKLIIFAGVSAGVFFL